jgi:hypothetical protein
MSCIKLLPVAKLLLVTVSTLSYFCPMEDQHIHLIPHKVENRVPRNYGVPEQGHRSVVTFQWTWASAAGWGVPEWSGDYIAICSFDWSSGQFWPFRIWSSEIWTLRAAGRQKSAPQCQFHCWVSESPTMTSEGPIRLWSELPI